MDLLPAHPSSRACFVQTCPGTTHGRPRARATLRGLPIVACAPVSPLCTPARARSHTHTPNLRRSHLERPPRGEDPEERPRKTQRPRYVARPVRRSGHRSDGSAALSINLVIQSRMRPKSRGGPRCVPLRLGMTLWPIRGQLCGGPEVDQGVDLGGPSCVDSESTLGPFGVDVGTIWSRCEVDSESIQSLFGVDPRSFWS